MLCAQVHQSLLDVLVQLGVTGDDVTSSMLDLIPDVGDFSKMSDAM